MNSTSFIKGDPRLIGKKQSLEHKELRLSQIRKRIKIQCNFCGNYIEIVPFILNNSKHHFCNRQCYKAWQKKTNWFHNRSYILTTEGKKILSENKKGIKNPRYKSWMTMSETEKIEWIKYMREKNTTRPTKPEKLLMEIIKKYNLPYKYVGDGQFWISNINPDFVNINGDRTVIEVYGDYWHNRDDVKLLDKKKDGILKQYGWEKIIIWENELKNFLPKELSQKIIKGGNNYAL